MQSSNRKRIFFSTAVTVSVALHAIVCLAVLILPVPAAAQDDGSPTRHGLSGSLGAGVVNTTTYEGSPNRRTVVGPDFSLSYHTKGWGSVELGQRGLVWQALEVADVRLGLAVAVDPGRKTKESSVGDPTPGDSRLAGMSDVRASVEAGVLVGYGPFSLLARKSVGDRGHQGAQMDINAEFPLVLTDRVGVRFGVSATWADKRYMQANFGVTTAQALASGFHAYTPKAGMRKLEASVGTEYALAKDWKLQGALQLSHLTGDAEDSPLVARKSSTSVSLGIAYSF